MRHKNDHPNHKKRSKASNHEIKNCKAGVLTMCCGRTSRWTNMHGNTCGLME